MLAGNKSRTYVVGHLNPDTDAIASAVGYAWLLRERQGDDIVAARAGQINSQTSWLLDRLGLEAPLLLTDASARFESIAHRFDTATPDRPLREVWRIAGHTGGVAPIVNENGTPYGLVTALSLFKFLSDTVGQLGQREELRVRELLDRPSADACDADAPVFRAAGRIRDSLNRILHQERNEFWVVDDNGLYVGICRQREALHPPRLKLILVDHNEASQALAALDEADLSEVLDHHRLGNPATRIPIRFSVDVVGSTSTLVSERIFDAGLSAPPTIAGLLLSGLLSDTLILTSPTTTDRDRLAADRLHRWAFIGGSPLAGETIASFGEQLLQAGAGLASRSPQEIVTSDLKLYEAGSRRFGISQVEVTSFHELPERLGQLKSALEQTRASKGLSFVALMVTDVVRGSSRLLLTDDLPALSELPYAREADGTLQAPGLVSRKKQLLPIILGALEG